MPEFTLLAELIPESIERMDIELSNIRKILDNILAVEIASNPDAVVPWDVPLPSEKAEKHDEFCKRR